MRDITGVYGIFNTETGDCYVGSSKNLFRRVKGHFTHLGLGTHVNPIFQRAWNKYGKDVFVWVVLQGVEFEEELIPTEQGWIDCLPSKYNILKLAGRSTGYRYNLSLEACAKISKAAKGRPKSEAHKQALREANLGKKYSPETVEKRASQLRGRKISAEQKAQISRRHKGKVYGEESRKKMTEYRTGRPWTDARREAWRKRYGQKNTDAPSGTGP